MNQFFAGDFSLKEVKLYPVKDEGGLAGNRKFIDIKQLVQEVTINESIISTSLYCQLVIQDIGNNIIGELPIIGQERIQLIISTSYADYNLNFYIYKIDGRVMKEKNQVYVIHAVSKEALINEHTRIRERIDGKKAEDFLKEKLELISDKTFEGRVDSTLHPFDMYVTNWRLFDTAIWMSRRSVSTKYKDSVGYLFYETLDGYNFKSLDVLFDTTPYPNKNTKYTFIQGNTSSTGSDSNNYRIMDYSSTKAFDIFEDLRNGAFSHNALYVDINNRNYQNWNTNASTYWKDMSHLGNMTPFPNEDLLKNPSRLVYRPTTISTFNWKPMSSSQIESLNNIDEVNKTFEKSIYRYYFLEYNKLEVAIPGDLKLRAGNVINVSIPSPKRDKTNKVVEDKRISGKYLVHSIRHTILNRTELRTIATLTRDSFGGNEINPISVETRETF
jgi:hypothetical protein